MPVPYLERPPKVIPIDGGRQPFMDDFLIEKTNPKRTYHQAEKYAAKPVFVPQTEEEITRSAAVFLGQGGVFYDPRESLFTMFYAAEWRGGLAMATSKDMIHWEQARLLLPPGPKWTGPELKTAETDNCVWLDTSTTNQAQPLKFLTAECMCRQNNDRKDSIIHHRSPPTDTAGVTDNRPGWPTVIAPSFTIPSATLGFSASKKPARTDAAATTTSAKIFCKAPTGPRPSIGSTRRRAGYVHRLRYRNRYVATRRFRLHGCRHNDAATHAGALSVPESLDPFSLHSIGGFHRVFVQRSVITIQDAKWKAALFQEVECSKANCWGKRKTICHRSNWIVLTVASISKPTMNSAAKGTTARHATGRSSFPQRQHPAPLPRSRALPLPHHLLRRWPQVLTRSVKCLR